MRQHSNDLVAFECACCGELIIVVGGPAPALFNHCDPHLWTSPHVA